MRTDPDKVERSRRSFLKYDAHYKDQILAVHESYRAGRHKVPGELKKLILSLAIQRRIVRERFEAFLEENATPADKANATKIFNKYRGRKDRRIDKMRRRARAEWVRRKRRSRAYRDKRGAP